MEKNNNIICVTGTGTEVGKTVVTGLLAQYLGKNHDVITQKWVQSGNTQNPDIAIHDQYTKSSYPDHIQALRQVYTFKAPMSPHLAAQLEGKTINTQHLIHATTALSQHCDTVLLETSGGIMVPLNKNETTGDIVAKMGIPTIVVAPNQLGTINHTLLTIHYLKSKGIPILGFIMNTFFATQADIEKDNPRIISDLSGVPCIGHVGADIITNLDDKTFD